MAAHPFMVAGDGRACTRIVGTAGKRVLVKFGAEGVFFAALYEQGFGLALKVRDGATRAADAAIAAMLDRLGVLDKGDRKALGRYAGEAAPQLGGPPRRRRPHRARRGLVREGETQCSSFRISPAGCCARTISTIWAGPPGT